MPGDSLPRSWSDSRIDRTSSFSGCRAAAFRSCTISVLLHVPLDVFLVRKLGVPQHPELAMGALAEGGVEVLSRDLVRDLGIPAAMVEQVAVQERLEMERRDARYRAGRGLPVLRDQTALVVDDGLATGSTMEAAILNALRQYAAARIIVAVPVGARETCDRLRGIADEVVCLSMPESFDAVGRWYTDDFSQTSDEEVIELLSARRQSDVAP